MIDDNWTPTPKNINALPEPVRKYIHDLETLRNPAGIVAESALVKDKIRMRDNKIAGLQAEVDRLSLALEKALRHGIKISRIVNGKMRANFPLARLRVSSAQASDLEIGRDQPRPLAILAARRSIQARSSGE